MNDLNQIIVSWPTCMPAIVEKSRVLLLQGAWEVSLLQAACVLKRDSKDCAADMLAAGALRCCPTS